PDPGPDPDPPKEITIIDENLTPDMEGVSDPEYIRPIGDGPGYYWCTEQMQVLLGSKENIHSPLPMTPKPRLVEDHEAESEKPQDPLTKLPEENHDKAASKKYLMVDLKLEMGIGEVKSAIEHSVYAAHLTKRTLVLPSSLYFRGCSNERLCKMTHKEVELLTPSDEGTVRRKRWAIPIERIYDIDRMQQYIDVVLVDDWVNMMVEREHGNNVLQGEKSKKLSGLDWLSNNSHQQFTYSAANHDELLKQFKKVSVHGQDIHQFLYEPSGTILESRAGFNDHTFGTVYGYPTSFSRNLNFTWKWDINDRNFVGFVETFAPVEEEVLYLHGGITKYGQPMLNFGSIAARDAFEDVSMEWVQFSRDLKIAADYLVRNLLELTGGRNYLAVHYRRGLDFLHSPIPDATGDREKYRMGLGTQDISSAMLKINALLMRDNTAGRFQLEDLDEWTDGITITDEDRERQEKQTEKIQDLQRLLPKGQSHMNHYTRERFYFMATDERDPVTLGSMKEQGALLIGDLLDKDFLQSHLDMMGFPDWYAYLEQLICIKARSFLGSPMSVFSGSIINQRIRHNRNGKLGNGWLYRPVP
ncbi:hypothetical protein BGZ46_005336, partial [Entomortierella lignicola]